MNSEKIVVEIKCVGIDKVFDCIVPRKITGAALCENVFALIKDNYGISFGVYSNSIVVSSRTEKAIVPTLSLDENGIDSGDTLYVI